MICEMRDKRIVLVLDLFIVSFFAEPACCGESLPTRTVLVVVVVVDVVVYFVCCIAESARVRVEPFFTLTVLACLQYFVGKIYKLLLSNLL